MKVSPVAQGSGVPAGASVGQERMPADKIAAAKAIAEGRTPVRQSESDTYVDPLARVAMKSIKMKTNVSPERYLDAEMPAEGQPGAESAIPDANGTANAVTEDTKPLSPQLAAIAKQRRALQVKERELADREKAFKERENPQASSQDIIAKLKSDPLSVLQANGVTYDQLTEAILASQSGNTPDIRRLEAEQKALEERFDKKLSDREAAQETAVLAEMRREAELLIKEGDDFETVRATKSVDDAMDLIKRTYKSTGEVLDVTEALKLIEDELVNDILKVANLKKVQNKLRPPEVTVPQVQQSQNKLLRTLTNRDTSSVPLDRKARAMKAFYGQK